MELESSDACDYTGVLHLFLIFLPAAFWNCMSAFCLLSYLFRIIDLEKKLGGKYMTLHLFPPGATQPIVGVYFAALYRSLASSRTRLLDHTKRRATVGRTTLNE